MGALRLIKYPSFANNKKEEDTAGKLQVCKWFFANYGK